MDSGSTPHLVNSIKNITNIQEVKDIANTRNKKTMTGYILFDWERYHKRDGILYSMTCNNKLHMMDLSVTISSVTHVIIRGLKITPEKEIIELNKNTNTLLFEDQKYHGNGDGYLLSTRLYATPQNYGIIDI